MGYQTYLGVLAHGPVTRSPVTATVLGAYAMRADDETRMAYYSRAKLARLAKTNSRVLRKSIKELVDKGFLVDTGMTAKGITGQTPKIYMVNYECNSLCFVANPKEHYPEGNPALKNERLYPKSDIEEEHGF